VKKEDATIQGIKGDVLPAVSGNEKYIFIFIFFKNVFCS
jgi:hypothetical protein